MTDDLVRSISMPALLLRRAKLREAVEEQRRVYLEMHALRRALFDGDPSGDEIDYDLSLEWQHRTGRWRSSLEHQEAVDDAFKSIDAACWTHVMAKSGLEQLMDQKQRAEWRKQIDDHEMPEFTYDNVASTFTGLAARRGSIFEDGVVNVFRQLSHDYETNNPRMLGKRLIATYASERHTWRHNDKHPDPALRGRPYTQVYGPSHSFADKLDDLVRAFCTLEGKPEPSHDQGAYAILARGEWMKGEHNVGVAPDIRDVELHGYLKFRGYKNGNAHLTFLRLDLVDKLNGIIAKHFPNALPPAKEAA